MIGIERLASLFPGVGLAIKGLGFAQARQCLPQSEPDATVPGKNAPWQVFPNSDPRTGQLDKAAAEQLGIDLQQTYRDPCAAIEAAVTINQRVGAYTSDQKNLIYQRNDPEATMVDEKTKNT